MAIACGLVWFCGAALGEVNFDLILLPGSWVFYFYLSTFFVSRESLLLLPESSNLYTRIEVKRERGQIFV